MGPVSPERSTLPSVTGTDNKRKAEAYLLEKRLEASQGTYAPNASRVTVNELVDAKLTCDKNNNLKSLNCSEGRWRLHLQPFFGHVKAATVTTPLIAKYIQKRQGEGAENATINRDLQFLRAAFNLARKSCAIRVVPYFPLLKEDNIRKGFLRDDQYAALANACAAEGLWLRAMFEVAQSFAWSKGELQTLKVGQIEFFSKTIRVYDPKNNEGKVVVMTDVVLELLTACCAGKSQDEYVFTRPKGTPIVDFRKNWTRATKAAGCPDLHFHDLCRTGMRNMRRLGVDETVAMKVAGRKTASIFRRYNIVDERDLREASRLISEKQKVQFSHTLAIVQPKEEQPQDSLGVKTVRTQ